MRHILIALIAVIIVLAGCNKQQIPNIPINPALMQNYGFKQGTYWIYLDSVSGEVDSFVVTSTEDVIDYGSNFSESVSIMHVSIYENNTFYEVLRLGLSDSMFSFSIDSTPTTLENSYNGTLFYYPIYKGYYDSTSTGIGGIADIYPTYSYNGKSFTNVAKIRRFNSAIVYEGIIVDDWFYSCDKIGFIKIVFNHPQDSVYKNWNLLRYHIAL